MFIKWYKRKCQKNALKRELFLVKKNIEKLNEHKQLTLFNPDELVLNQIEDTNTIPVIIINFNQLDYLKKLINFLIKRGNKNIVIIDNKSTYEPLLDYYKQIKCNEIKVVYKNKNLGHLVFWKDRKLFKKYSKGFYIVTDADIVPNNNLPIDYLNQMIKLLFKYSDKTKVGFSLDVENIPDNYSLKEKVINWESKFWINELEPNVYNADIDTTFALYWPKVDRLPQYLYTSFFNAIRIGADYTAQHGGWYVDYKNLTNEQAYYLKTSSNSNSWKIDENGVLKGGFVKDY